MGFLGICADVCVAIDFGISLAYGHNTGHFRLEWRWLVTADRSGLILRYEASMGQLEHRTST
jgi:hypothetical protein